MTSIIGSYFGHSASTYRIILALQIILTTFASLIAGHSGAEGSNLDLTPALETPLLEGNFISNALLNERAMPSNGPTTKTRSASRWETPGSFKSCNATICRPLNKYPYLEEMCLPEVRVNLTSIGNQTCDLCCPILYKPTRLENLCSAVIKCHNDNLLEKTVRTHNFKDCTKIECCARHANFTDTVGEHCSRVAKAEGLSFYGLLIGIAALLLLGLAYLLIRQCIRKRRQQKAPATTHGISTTDGMNDGTNDTQPKRMALNWLQLAHSRPPFSVKPRKVSVTNQAEQGISPVKSKKLKQRKSTAVSREE